MDGIKVTRKTKSILVKIKHHEKFHKEGLVDAHHEIGARVIDRNKQLISSGPKTGRIYGTHQASAPGQSPANRSGRLLRSAKFLVHGWETMSVGQEAEYATFLEDGTRRIAPRPNMIAAVNFVAGQSLLTYLRYIKKKVDP